VFENLHLPEAEIEVDGEALEKLVNDRVRARAARADVAVAIDTPTLERWAREELESVVADLARAHLLAHGRVLN
jgi:hypothetical protein